MNTQTVKTILCIEKDFTIFIPGHFGDDPFYPKWESTDSVLLSYWNRESILQEDIDTSYRITDKWLRDNGKYELVNIQKTNIKCE